MNKLIGLYGRARSGKDTVAKWLGYQRISFADPLKVIVADLVKVPLKYFHYDELKDRFDWFDLHGVPVYTTPRKLVIAYGTGFGRSVDDDLWCKKAMMELDPQKETVFSDVRFLNEAEAIQKKGGMLIHLKRLNFKHPVESSSSEGLLDDWDGFDHVVEASSLKSLDYQIKRIMQGERCYTRNRQ